MFSTSRCDSVDLNLASREQANQPDHHPGASMSISSRMPAANDRDAASNRRSRLCRKGRAATAPPRSPTTTRAAGCCPGRPDKAPIPKLCSGARRAPRPKAEGAASRPVPPGVPGTAC
jgi:hypothetical protein